MKKVESVRVRLGASRIAEALVLSISSALSLVLALLPLPAPVRMLAVCAVGAYALLLSRGWARRAAPTSVVAVDVAWNRAIVLIAQDGTRTTATLQWDTYVSAAVTCLVWKLPGSRFARSTALLPDMMARTDFRRLRVMLRASRDGTREIIRPRSSASVWRR
jgi:hypothetical protein